IECLLAARSVPRLRRSRRGGFRPAALSLAPTQAGVVAPGARSARGGCGGIAQVASLSDTGRNEAPVFRPGRLLTWGGPAMPTLHPTRSLLLAATMVASMAAWPAAAQQPPAAGAPAAAQPLPPGSPLIGRPDSNPAAAKLAPRSEEHTSELQSRENLVCRLLLEK